MEIDTHRLRQECAGRGVVRLGGGGPDVRLHAGPSPAFRQPSSAGTANVNADTIITARRRQHEHEHAPTGRPQRIAGVTMTAATSDLVAIAPVPVLAHQRSAAAPESTVAKVSRFDFDLATAQSSSIARKRLMATEARRCSRFADARRVSGTATIEDCAPDAPKDALRRLDVHPMAMAE